MHRERATARPTNAIGPAAVALQQSRTMTASTVVRTAVARGR